MTEKIDGRKSPENIERLKRQGFQKGNPPPKGSGRKKLPEELKHAVVNATLDALEMMIDMMHNSPNEQVRYKAAEWILSSVIPAAVTSTYPELRAFGLARGWAVNGSGNPILPDMGGYFARGWRSGQTIDSGRVFGSIQQDAFQGHKHGQQDDPTKYGGSGSGVVPVTGQSATAVGPYLVGNPYTDGVNGVPRTASETRPINITVTYWIKAFSSGQTSGTADLTQLGNDVSSLSVRTTSLEANGRIPIFVCFNGTGTIAIWKSSGVSSLTDLGTGRYKINFASALPDANYAFSTTGLSGTTTQILWGCVEEVTTSSITVRFVNKNIGLNDDNLTDHRMYL